MFFTMNKPQAAIGMSRSRVFGLTWTGGIAVDGGVMGEVVRLESFESDFGSTRIYWTDVEVVRSVDTLDSIEICLDCGVWGNRVQFDEPTELELC